jgi:hypothetical protein
VWRILRLPSLTDKFTSKHNEFACKKTKFKIDEDESGEFIGIINYSIMALIQLELGVVDQPDLEVKKATALFDAKIKLTKDLMEAKIMTMERLGGKCVLVL